MSKWFYDTSLSNATRAARRGSLIGGIKAFHARGVSHEGTRWFTWFGPPERNTYVHGRMKVVVLLCVLFNSRVELALKSLRELV
jgi:hypothetical protein